MMNYQILKFAKLLRAAKQLSTGFTATCKIIETGRTVFNGF